MLVYEHVGSVTEKVHIHLVIVEADTGKKWLRELGSRHGINLKGNKFCSFKEFDGNETAMVYMTKGVYEPSFNKGFDPADIARWKSQWVDKPKSRDAMIYEHAFGDAEYNKEMYENWIKDHPIDPKEVCHQFKWVKAKSYTTALMNNGYIVNLKTINEYKMLVYTYCARNNVLIPPDEPTFKKLG